MVADSDVAASLDAGLREYSHTPDDKGPLNVPAKVGLSTDLSHSRWRFCSLSDDGCSPALVEAYFDHM